MNTILCLIFCLKVGTLISLGLSLLIFCLDLVKSRKNPIFELHETTGFLRQIPSVDVLVSNRETLTGVHQPRYSKIIHHWYRCCDDRLITEHQFRLPSFHFLFSIFTETTEGNEELEGPFTTSGPRPPPYFV